MSVISAGATTASVAFAEERPWNSTMTTPVLPAIVPGGGCSNHFILRRTPYTVSLYTSLRAKETKQADFVSATRKLTALLLNEAMSLLPTFPRTIQTPCGPYCGLELPEPSTDLCVVSILRAADSMAESISHQHPGIPVGKILIQRDEETAQPKLFFAKLPKDIKSRLVLLVDPMLATGGSARQAIAEIKKAGVPDANIIMLSIVAAPEGLQALAAAHPRVRVLVGEVDQRLNERAYIVPGLGDFGDRYYGTD